jgi:hypothetical protein
MLYTPSSSDYDISDIHFCCPATTGKSMKEVKILTDQAYGCMSLNRAWIYQPIKEVKVEKITAD